MNKLLLRNIFAVLLYTGFYTVQLKAGFLIQENIKFRNDYNCLKQLDKSLHGAMAFHKASKNIGKHKRSNMSRRFIPEDIKQVQENSIAKHIPFTTTHSKSALQNRILQIDIVQLEDRGPPAIV